MAAVARTPRRVDGTAAWWSAARFALVEALLWAAVYGGYLLVRDVAIGSPAEAQRHAHAVVRLERTLGVAREAAVQHAAEPLQRVLSVYYVLGFGPLVAAVLDWLA